MMRKNAHLFIFLIATLVFVLLGGFFLLTSSKTEIHLFINRQHFALADVFFKNLTYLGEGWMFLLAAPVMVFYSWRSGIAIALAGVFTGAFTGFFKNLLFNGAPRPIEYFSGIEVLYLVPGVEMNHWNSFPSGHTMAAFALYFTLAFLVKSKKWSLVFFLIAALVGYSRMYLSQHFLVDVVAGAGLGIIASSLAILIATKLPFAVLDSSLVENLKN